MRWLVTVVALLIAISSVSAAEVHIFVDKESVNLGDQIRFQVYFEVNRSADIAVVGDGGDGALLCHVDEGEDLYEKCGEEWVFRIPEDWQEGTYRLKVVIDDTEPEEHSEEFKVVKPKIKEFELKNLVYQSRTELEVLVESANPASLKLRLYGNNVDLYYEETADYEEESNIYSAKFDLNLRELYERTRDIADAVKPGKYTLDLKLEYGGKVWDSRRVTASVVKPEVAVSAPEKVKVGEPVVVSIDTNRFGDTEYDGILVVLEGNNFLLYKKAYLDENGKAKVQFETAGLREGKYAIYVRDTSKTSTLSISDLAKNYYDLPPDNSFSRIIQAEDDVLVKKELWIVGDGKESVKVILQPSKAEIFNGTTMSFKVLLNQSVELSSFEFVIFVSGNSVKIESVTLPDGFRLLDKTLYPDYLKISAYTTNKTKTGFLAEVKVAAQSPGESRLLIKSAGVYNGLGEFVDVTTSQADVVVKESRKEGNTANVSITLKENATSAENVTNNSVTATTPPAKASQQTPAPATPPVSMNVGEIDFTKVFMFTAGFLATYSAGRIMMRKLSARGGKR